MALKEILPGFSRPACQARDQELGFKVLGLGLTWSRKGPALSGFLIAVSTVYIYIHTYICTYIYIYIYIEFLKKDRVFWATARIWG